MFVSSCTTCDRISPVSNIEPNDVQQTNKGWRLIALGWCDAHGAQCKCKIYET